MKARLNTCSLRQTFYSLACANIFAPAFNVFGRNLIFYHFSGTCSVQFSGFKGSTFPLVTNILEPKLMHCIVGMELVAQKTK
jgi:hypothetical protein